MQDYNSKFDLRKPMERALFNAENVECLSLQGGGSFALLEEKCAAFCSKLSRSARLMLPLGRAAKFHVV